MERRDGAWRIADRKSVYDFATFTFPAGIRDIDADVVAKYPREYAALAYVLDRSGFPVERTFATQGSELEREIKESAFAWLSAETEA
ncbi:MULTISPECIES: hypothetical protein [unclassified Streptomyces]|uniref:hypothetical protein n=1 Tax=unclassified Streptomyces TaxID=2593676 RepID=UPI00278BF9EE|nr:MULTISPECIES: hypothetical protein [unclassified Streptomyces]